MCPKEIHPTEESRAMGGPTQQVSYQALEVVGLALVSEARRGNLYYISFATQSF
jgi:hypothetical protein